MRQWTAVIREGSTQAGFAANLGGLLRMVQRLSKRSTAEIDALREALIERFRSLQSPKRPAALLGAGTTRLGKIEFLTGGSPSLSNLSGRSYRRLEESILIRIRQERYSSAGIIAPRGLCGELEIRIHLEHRTGYALSLEIPYRAKRPQFLSLGRCRAGDVSAKWFREPGPPFQY